ncbi:MAG: tetratricopeptide repeat protein [Chitinophagaceae bacterium]|nr:tetratricopeptide repeat protein [Chitinophagaceae bacterium]
MKFILSWILLISSFLNAQTATQIIINAKHLIEQKKYDSAFNLLNHFDPKNGNIEAVLLKEEIVLNYFVSSMMHQLFALKDLSKNEKIEDFRGKEGTYSMHMFEVDQILDSLLKIYPNNCKLNKGLGDFYYEVHLKYGDRWLKTNKELFKLIEENYSQSINNNCANFLDYYVMGYIKTTQEKYKEAIPYFTKSIQLNNNYTSAQYNLAYCFLYLDERDSALIYAKQALEKYEDVSYKSDAARMVAQIYTELNDDKNAIVFYEKANFIDINNYDNLKPLLNIYLKTNHHNSSQITSLFFNLDAGNPTIYNDLEEIFWNHKKENELILFYKEKLNENKNEPKVFGNLNFYLAKLHMEKDKKLSKHYFETAKDSFAKIFKPTHEIFKIIKDGLSELNK